MDNFKNDHFYITEMLSDIEFILQHTNTMTREKFDSNVLLQDSMMFRLIQISESSLRLSENFKAAHSDIPWHAIKGLRNRIVHDYGNIDLTTVYDTLINDIPEIYSMLKTMN